MGGLADAGALFVSGTTLYKVNRGTGELSSTDWANGAPTGAFVVRSGPAMDGTDWRAKAVFVGP